MQNRLEMLRIYCAAVEAESFKEAATRLGTSPQAVTRAVQEAEALVGEILFHRNTRRVRATEAGEAFAHRARDLVRQMDELLRPKDSEIDAEIAGLVRLTAPKSIGERFLMPALARLAEKHPRIMLDLRLSDAISDPIAEQIDIGVRIGFMRDSRFVVRPASRVGFSVVASPKLIARVGEPTDLAALALLPTTGFIDRNTGRLWPWQFANGQQFTPANLAFQTDDGECECRAVVAGLGFGQIVSYLAQPLLRAGKVISVLDSYAPEAWPVYVYRPQRGPVPARIRLVFDAMLAALEKSELQ
ncbi:LysR family transcriptional regulator [Caballeronia mineralivorans PML1(12)]|uniref:LysR family transcriptional regulator n=1 Tax=Caballeronia mineralivorans PML1(12) TaxID=908627 RepID=A0A0J1CXW7_9BURK|nr:LysR family transcriptional regulator [Caballeronia mineralivorans]KLU25191.1 LysR family transcriptional regulator [Caballeronia mineralivorans PML1(12)]